MRTEEALLLLNREGAIQWTNVAAANLLGYTCEELVEMALPAVITGVGPSSAPDGPVAAAFRALLSGKSQNSEGDARFPSKGNKRVAVHWKLWVLPSRPREPQILLSLSETAQASAEGPITSGYRDIFEYAIEGIFRTSLEGRFLEVNPSLARIYGYSTPSELMAATRDLNTDLYVEPGRRAEFVALMHKQGFVEDFESEIFRADGALIWTSEFARAVRGPDGLALYFEGSLIDITARKRAEQALQASEAKFRHLVETTNVVPFEADVATGRINYVGPQALRFLGYPIEAWRHPGFHEEHIHKDDQRWVSEVRAEAIKSKRQNFECEYRMIDAYHRVVWAREIVSLMTSESRQPVFGGFFLNVTHQHESEVSLEESRRFIEQIASASPTILHLYDPEKRQSIYVSGRVIDILGYTPEELLGMRPFFVLALAHPDEVDAHRNHLELLQSGERGVMLEREYRLRSSAGGWVWLHSRECVFKAEEGGKVLRMVGTLEDVTKHRHALEDLKMNEARFRQLAESTRVIPFDYDIEASCFSYVGPQAEALIGHPLNHWYSAEMWRTMIHPNDIEEGTRFSRNAALEEDFETEFRLIGPASRMIWVRQIVHVGAENSRSHLRGFFLDITEAKMAQEEREQAGQQFRELAARHQLVREEERVSVARDIHDELGQALTSLKLDLSWLGTRLSKPLDEHSVGPLEEKIHSMEEMISRTLQTVRRILSALRPPLLDELGLRAAIEWHAQDCAKRLGIRYEIDITSTEILPQAASIAIFRVFQEILTNVARHSRASRIKISLRSIGSHLVLEVEDNGCGIAPERAAGATSFGLLGMRERAWMVGGELAITGRPGVGTTVTLKVPVQPAAASSIAMPKAISNKPARSI